jgi:hypothetical protein
MGVNIQENFINILNKIKILKPIKFGKIHKLLVSKIHLFSLL